MGDARIQQYLTRRAENVALQGMFKKLIALNQATLDDLVEFSYIAALGDGNGAGSAEDSGGRHSTMPPRSCRSLSDFAEFQSWLRVRFSVSCQNSFRNGAIA